MALTLASNSAARRAILAGAGAAFETYASGVDEDAIKAAALGEGASPKAIAERLAAAKALAVSEARVGLVLGADQTLDLDGQLFDKARDIGEAEARLRLFRGKTHQLHSALALAENGAVVWTETASASLTMRQFGDGFLARYLEEEGAQALGSVGCYRLEGPGVQLFSAIDGDYFTILGLPLMGLLDELRRRGEIAS